MQYTDHLKHEHRHESLVSPGDWRNQMNFRSRDFPNIVHVDSSARIQTLRRHLHPRFHHIITEFEKITGEPMIINTSFNVSGEPIVRAAADSWQCFRHTEIDFLIVGDILLHNPPNTSEEEKDTWSKQFDEQS